MLYKNFTTEDFARDKTFRQWVLQPNPSSNIFWNRFLSENPDKRTVVKQASAIVREMRFPDPLGAGICRKSR